MTSLQEYDLEIKPVKIVKGHDPCKHVAKAQDPHDGEEGWENDAEMLEREVHFVRATTNSWYIDLKYYLTHGSGQGHLEAWKRQALRLKSSQY